MSFISKNNPENKEVPYVVTVKFFVMAKNEEDAKILVIQNNEDLVDWKFDNVVNNQAEYNSRKLELKRIENIMRSEQ